MKHGGLKFLSLLLTLVMVLGMLPGMTAFAGTATYTTLKNNATPVTFNGMQWYIIEDNSTAMDAGTLTLLLADPTQLSVFRAPISTTPLIRNGNAYAGSDIQANLDGAITGSAANAIVPTDLPDVGVTGAKLWLLSEDEAGALDDSVKNVNKKWWLRSPSTANQHQVMVMYGNGTAQANWSNLATRYIRPALKLDLTKVVFDSATNTFTLGYTVTYIANNDTNEKVVEDNRAAGDYIIQAYDKNFTVPDGKVFDYWKGSDDGKYRDGQTIQLNADLTLTAQWKDEEKPDDGKKKTGGSGSGFDLVFNIPGVDNTWEYVGGYAPQQAYRVSLAPMQGGSAALGLTTGESGETLNVYPSTTVYVFPEAEQGYTLDKIVWSLIDGSASYDITEAKTFVMPAMDVVVYVTFRPVG